MQNKKQVVIYTILTAFVLLVIVVLYIYAQVLWQQNTESTVTEDTVPAVTESDTENRQAILDQVSPNTENLSREERQQILDSTNEAETRDSTLSQEERHAILNQE